MVGYDGFSMAEVLELQERKKRNREIERKANEKSAQAVQAKFGIQVIKNGDLKNLEGLLGELHIPQNPVCLTIERSTFFWQDPALSIEKCYWAAARYAKKQGFNAMHNAGGFWCDGGDAKYEFHFYKLPERIERAF